MTTVEDQRYRMHNAFREAHGEEVASVIMEHLPPAGWSHLATKQDVELVRTELKSEMQVLRAELKEEMHKSNVQNLRWTVGLVVLVQAAFFAAGSYF
jgi:hypothetical protein